MKSQVIMVTVMLFSYVCATNYKEEYGGVGEKAAGSRQRDESGGYVGGRNYRRKPHRTEYTVDDGKGNSHYRYEYTDEFGAVRGTYGYNDASGLYRVVEYVADARGFRANVKTNEPGAANVRTMPERTSVIMSVNRKAPDERNAMTVCVNATLPVADHLPGYQMQGGYGGGSGSPSVGDVTGAIQNTACDIGEDYDIELCLQEIGSG